MKPSSESNKDLDSFQAASFASLANMRAWSGKKLGIAPHLILVSLILYTPWWLFGLGRLPAWVLEKSPVTTYVHQNLNYRLHSDDFAYIGSSRTWPRTVENLLVPHNTHICPSWRLLTWGVVAAAGDLVHLQDVMKPVSYLALVLVMLQVGHFVAHESRSMALGLGAMAAVGVTSLQRLSTMWYAAGQTLWAGLFIVTALILIQELLRRNWHWLWPSVVICCWIAGGFWTIGHAAGPVGAIYIMSVTRGRKRLLALIPFAATLVAVVFSLAFGGKAIDPTISFHGRTTREALGPIQGLSHTCHSIIETLILGNLGINATTTNTQAVILTIILFVCWLLWHVRSRQPVTALEWTGAALCISAYWVEWSFRGYFSWNNLKGIVTWYDSIPQIGWVMFLCGWLQAGTGMETAPAERSTIGKIWLNRGGFIGVFALLLVMMTLNQSDVDRQLLESTPRLTQYEIDKRMFPIPELKRLRANYIWDERAKRQKRNLQRLQEAEKIAQARGWGSRDISAALGRVSLPEIPKVYDAVLMLNLPETGKTQADPAEIRRLLGNLLALEPEKTPQWLAGSNETWPPKGDETEQ